MNSGLSLEPPNSYRTLVSLTGVRQESGGSRLYFYPEMFGHI